MILRTRFIRPAAQSHGLIKLHPKREPGYRNARSHLDLDRIRKMIGQPLVCHFHHKTSIYQCQAILLTSAVPIPIP